MCGIFVIVGKNINIKKNLETIFHRGPDDQGTCVDEENKVVLGFCRLSIIDLSPQGHQPMGNENGRIQLVFNGEIYNYLELRKQLTNKHHFISKTDTEVLIHGYEEWGIEKLLIKLNGMFAFALYDKNKKCLFLARDRIGKKPLYCYQGAGYLAFASEVKAFFPLKDFRFNISHEVFDLWIGFPYLPDNTNTLLGGVTKIPPAAYVTIDVRSLEMKKFKYWEIENGGEILQNENAENKLEELLIDSVKKRLVADVPVGILLSGGLDSSLITAIAKRNSSDKIKTITVSFKNSSINESYFANLVADYCKTDHLNLELNVNNIYEEFRENINIFDDLTTVDGGLFSTYLLSKEIRKLGIKVVLVGEGADEIFGGYSWFGLSQFPFRFLPEMLRTKIYYYALMRSVSFKKIQKYSKIQEEKINESAGSYLKKMQSYEVRYSLPNHYCMKIDKGCSAASIEARAPYLDYRIVELASQLPDRMLLKTNFYNAKLPHEKYILRNIARKYLPEEICTRKKKGGMLPVADLLNEGLKLDSRLIIQNPVLREYFGEKYLVNLINNSSKNVFVLREREWLVWKMLVFSLWFKYYGGYQ